MENPPICAVVTGSAVAFWFLRSWWLQAALRRSFANHQRWLFDAAQARAGNVRLLTSALSLGAETPQQIRKSIQAAGLDLSREELTRWLLQGGDERDCWTVLGEVSPGLLARTEHGVCVFVETSGLSYVRCRLVGPGLVIDLSRTTPVAVSSIGSMPRRPSSMARRLIDRLFSATRRARGPAVGLLALSAGSLAPSFTFADSLHVSSHALTSAAGRRVPSAKGAAQEDLLERHRRFAPFIYDAASHYELPSAFLFAVMRVESNFEPRAVSRAGALGLMQLMPFNAQRLGISDPFDPRANTLGGARLLRELVNRWRGDLVLTVASYNAGAGAVQKYLERHRKLPPYPETRRYVQRVLRHYRAYSEGKILVRR